MSKIIDLRVRRQPDGAACGPTCLHAVYRYFEDEIPLSQVIDEVARLELGGTLAVYLGLHALQRGYRATLYTYNLRLFDPNWFGKDPPDLRQKLVTQARAKSDLRLQIASRAYVRFLELGGKIRFEVLEPALLERYFKREVPVLTGLSATYLYRESRERTWDAESDDERGVPVGHFVVLNGYDRSQRRVFVADPLHRENGSRSYSVGIHRLICAIMLGVLTYDGNCLVIEPRR